LLAVKKQVGHGGWLLWLDKNVPFTKRTAQGYMRMARDPRTLEFAHLGIAGVLEAIREHRPQIRNPVAHLPAGEEPMFDGGPPLSDEVVQEMRDHWWRKNQQMAVDPECRDWAHIGIGGVMRVVHDEDPDLAEPLGDEIVGRMKARVEQLIMTPSRPAIERALIGPMRMLREQQRDKVLAAVERHKAAA
jgi:hypothetical protein